MGNLGGDGNENDKKNTVNVKNKKFSKHKFNFLKRKKSPHNYCWPTLCSGIKIEMNLNSRLRLIRGPTAYGPPSVLIRLIFSASHS